MRTAFFDRRVRMILGSWQVLDQSPSHRHVQELQSATDTKDRQPVGPRAVELGGLEVIPRPIRCLRSIDDVPIEHWIDVSTAGKKQPVKIVKLRHRRIPGI